MSLAWMQPPARKYADRSPRFGGLIRTHPAKGVQIDPHGRHVGRRQIRPDLAFHFVQQALGDDDRETSEAPLVALVWPVVLKRVVKSERVPRTAESLGKAGK